MSARRLRGSVSESSPYTGRRARPLIGVLTLVLWCPALTAQSCPATSWLTPGAGTSNHHFGDEVMVHGNQLYITSSGDGSFGTVAVHDGVSGDPVDELQLPTLPAGTGAGFGWRMASDGQHVVVTARGTSGAPPGAAVYDAQTAALVRTLLPAGAGYSDQFGGAVDVDAGLVVIGASFDDTQGINAGSVYLFDAVAGTQLCKLAPEKLEVQDSFGMGVAIRGGTLAVTAQWDDDAGLNAGALYLYDISDPTQPVQTAKLTPGVAGDTFGASMRRDGDTLIVGATLDNDFTLGADVGSATLFDITTGAQLAKLIPATAEPGDSFGTTVALGGGFAVLAADGEFPDDRRVVVFDASTGAELTELETAREYADGLFGEVLATGDAGVWVAATHANAPSFKSGAVAHYANLKGAWIDLGDSLDGVAGRPTLSGQGMLTAGSQAQLVLDDAAPFADSVLVVGFDTLGASLKGGVLVPTPDIVLPGLDTGAGGGWSLTAPIPPGLPAGLAVYWQVWIPDAVGPAGLAASNGLLTLTPCP